MFSQPIIENIFKDALIFISSYFTFKKSTRSFMIYLFIMWLEQNLSLDNKTTLKLQECKQALRRVSYWIMFHLASLIYGADYIAEQFIIDE